MRIAFEMANNRKRKCISPVLSIPTWTHIMNSGRAGENPYHCGPTFISAPTKVKGNCTIWEWSRSQEPTQVSRIPLSSPGWIFFLLQMNKLKKIVNSFLFYIHTWGGICATSKCRQLLTGGIMPFCVFFPTPRQSKRQASRRIGYHYAISLTWSPCPPS